MDDEDAPGPRLPTARRIACETRGSGALRPALMVPRSSHLARTTSAHDGGGAALKRGYGCPMRANRIASLLLLGLSLVACASGSPGTSTGSPTPTDTSGTTASSSTASTASTASTTTAPPATSSTATASSDHVTGPYVLTSKQTGGIAAFHMETVIDSAAKTITYGGPRNQSPSTQDLSAAEVASLTRLIDDVGLAGFVGPLRGPAPSDAFTYEIVLRTGATARSISWTDGVTAPAPVLALRSFVTKLRDEKFRGNPTKDAPIK